MANPEHAAAILHGRSIPRDSPGCPHLRGGEGGACVRVYACTYVRVNVCVLGGTDKNLEWIGHFQSCARFLRTRECRLYSARAQINCQINVPTEHAA